MPLLSWDGCRVSNLEEALAELGESQKRRIVEVLLSYLPTEPRDSRWCLQAMFIEQEDKLFNPRITARGPDPMRLIESVKALMDEKSR